MEKTKNKVNETEIKEMARAIVIDLIIQNIPKKIIENVKELNKEEIKQVIDYVNNDLDKMFDSIDCCYYRLTFDDFVLSGYLKD